MGEIINIALATDDNYFLQTMLVIESVMKKADSQDEYCFYLLTDEEVFVNQKAAVKSTEKAYPNCKIQCVYMDDYFQNAKLYIDHITRPTYYRLLLPELIECQKCIYLDSDIIVNEDIKELFNIDMSGYLIAGVKAPSYHKLGDKEDDYKKETGLPAMDQYVNAGVLLMNLEEMRAQSFCSKALDVMERYKCPTQDQDVINQVCYGAIKLLPLRFNFQTVCVQWKQERLEGVFSIEEQEDAVNTPYVLHYSTVMKPWECFDIPYADIWWKVCKESSFYMDFYERYQKSFQYYETIEGQALWELEPFTESWIEEINCYKEIYVYGAGMIGTTVVKKMVSCGIKLSGIFVTSLGKHEPDSIEGITVTRFNDEINEEALIVVAVSEKYQMPIRRKLFSNDCFWVLPLTSV